MNRPQQFVRALFVLVTMLAAIGLWQWQTRPATAQSQVESAWQNVRRSDRYAFSADVAIETIPLATAQNIGRFSKKDGLYLEGSNNLREETLQLALWGGAVSAVNPAAAYHVRVQDGQAQTRSGDGPWQDSNGVDVAFAPDGDFMAFLEFATDIAYLGEAREAGAAISKYSFNIDSLSYANHLRRISQARLVAEGSLPPGVAMQMPAHLAAMDGTGELWVDSRGLPTRQIIRMEMPAAVGADYRTNAEMTIYFRSYEGVDLAVNWWQPLRSAGFALSQIALPSAAQAGSNAGILLATLLLVGALLRVRINRRMLVVFNSALLAIVVLSPLAQVGTGRAAAATLARYYDDNDIAPPDPIDDANVRAGLKPAPMFDVATLFAPRQPKVALDTLNLATAQSVSDVDTDEDGLSDALEIVIGTNPRHWDSDGDNISDGEEVTGFLLGGTRWYGNPLAPDTNFDGVIDTLEWNLTAPDSDGDGTPDLHDWDDDNDGVPDSVDMSRLASSKDDAGNTVAFNNSNPLLFTLDGVRRGSLAHVTLQIRPSNPDHLWYAYNVLNWPKDQLGNFQDWDGATLFQHCMVTGGNNCQMWPSDNGDISIVPMLEVRLSSLNNVPKLANSQPDEALLQKYNLALQPLSDGKYAIYAPLSVIEEPATGNKVAFETQLLFEGAGSWSQQQMRLVWAIQSLQDSYADAAAYEAAVAAGPAQTIRNNTPRLIHTYAGEFRLTGLNVREDRGVQMAIVYEDPATDANVNDDGPLVHLANGLRESYLVNRDCDFTDNTGKCIGDGQRDITIPVIQRRWDRFSNAGVTVGQRWGIEANRLRVETHTFRHEDEALVLGGSTHAPRILNDRFTGTAATMPTLLFVRESMFRALNLDGRSGTGPITWSGQSVRFDLSKEWLTVSAGFNTASYRYDTGANGWVVATAQEVVKENERRYPVGTGSARSDLQLITEEDQFALAVVTTVNTEGESAIVGLQKDSGSTALVSTFSPLQFSPPDWSDRGLQAAYQQAAGGVISTLGNYITMDFDSTRDLFTEGFKKAKVAANTSNNVVSPPQDNAPLSSSMDDIDDFLDDINVEPPVKENNFNKQYEALSANNRLKAFMLGFAVGVAVATVLFFTLTFTQNARTAGEIGLAAVGATSATVTAIATVSNTVNQLRAAAEINNTLFSLTDVLKVKHSITSSAGKAGAIGAIIGGVIVWAMFFAAWGKSGVAADSMEFYNLLANAITSTVLIVMNFILALSVVGLILQAIIALFDLFVLIACKAGATRACDVGIMKNLTAVMQATLYTSEVMIDTANNDYPIVNIENVSVKLTSPEKGYVVGNAARFTFDILTRVRHNEPKTSPVWHWPAFYTHEDIRSATVRYGLSFVEEEIKPGVDEMRDVWNVTQYGSASRFAPVPLLTWIYARKTKDLFQGVKTEQLTSPTYSFSEAGLNVQFPLYLNTGMGLPRYDCWWGFCARKSVSLSSPQNLTERTVLDILPATLDEFVYWEALGPQVDRDGDRLNAAYDGADNNPDSDGDGLNDFMERYQLGINATVADSDGDGLTDLVEVRYGTSPLRADSDSDGISDYDELNGYTLTLLGQQVRVTSDPLLRDTDRDGMSDGLERRLNALDPVAYPFSPRAFNESPVALYINTDDFDDIVGLDQMLTVTTTVANNTRLANNLLAQGGFAVQMPAQLGGADDSEDIALLPGTRATIVLSGTAISGQRFVSVTASADANLVMYDTTPRAPAADLELVEPLAIKIDYDHPDAPTLIAGQFIQPDLTAIIGGTASDPTSYVRRVDVSVDGGAYLTATDTLLWSYALDVPNMASGTLPIAVRVTDAVGLQTTQPFTLTIDSVQPVSTVALQPDSIHRVRRNAAGAWTLALSGNASDALAGLNTLTLQIGRSSEVRVPAAAIESDGDWAFAYPFDDIAFNTDPQPTGVYTLTVTATDNALPLGNPHVQKIPFVIDMTPPEVVLLSHDNDTQLLTGAVLTGTVSDTWSTVASVEYAFVAADTAFNTERTLLNLPLNDLPQTVLFANPAGTASRIFCLDESCPTANVSGADGTAAQFDGNDVLRSQSLTLPQTGTTTAFWFKTECADCGLFSRLQGAYPDHTGHDFDLFLANGNVCMQFNNSDVVDEVRCTPDNDYNDGEWHFLVHTVGTQFGNHLYIDGVPAVSSPTTAGPVSGVNHLAVGYSPAAATPFLTGTLDNVVIYAAELSTAAAANLYRAWQPATLAGDGTWSFALPEGLEGQFQIDMRAVDALGNRLDTRGEWAQYRGPVDSRVPQIDVAVTYSGSGNAAQTEYTAKVSDLNLVTADDTGGGARRSPAEDATEVIYDFVCPTNSRRLIYAAAADYRAFAGDEAIETLAGLDDRCLQNGYQSSLVSAYACDAFGHCAAGTPPQTVAFIGTTLNTLSPFGTLPNAIERANLSDPAGRVRLIERPGRAILDIEVDLTGGKLYWAEGTPGTGQPNAGEIWRANLDGSGQERLFSGLAANLHDQLQIALDVPGFKLYWTAGRQLYWANMDGSQPEPIYAVPDDPRYIGGNRDFHAIGDVAVDETNRILYISERRNRLPISNSNPVYSHSLIVALNPQGGSPAIVWGAADGCTYANWNSQLNPLISDLCLDPNGGADVEALTVANGTLYWAAYAGVSAALQATDSGLVPIGGPQDPAVWGKRAGEAAFRVATLPGLSDNRLGVNYGPVPHLHVNPTSGGVFAQNGTRIVRAESGGSFTIFTDLVDNTPAGPGATTRKSSTLTALDIVEFAGAVATETDLRVEVRSPDLVLIDGDSGHYNISVANASALPAVDAVVTVTLPAGTGVLSSTVAAACSGSSVLTCDLGTLAAWSTFDFNVEFSLATDVVRTLSATFAVTSTTTESAGGDNSVTFDAIRAAPSLAEIDGLPYLYYQLDTTQMVRVPLFGDYAPEPMQFQSASTTLYPGQDLALGAAPDGETLYFFSETNGLAQIDPQGGSYSLLADAYPDTPGVPETTEAGWGRNLAVATDPATGDIYYSEQVSSVWSRIRRMHAAAGTGTTTINDRVLLLDSLAVDHVRGKLYWIAGDEQMRRTLIYRSNLDGSGVEIVFSAPVGSQIRDLAIDPFGQSLFWLDPAYEGGSLFRADSSGQQVVVLSRYNGSGLRGLVVRPAQDAIFYVTGGGELMRIALDGQDEQWVADLNSGRVSRPSNLDPAQLFWGRIDLPQSQLVYAVGAAFPPSPCGAADSNEPNDSAATATAIAVGSVSGALCRDSLAAATDSDYYRLSVPSGQQLNVTLRNLPADYNLQIRQGDGIVATSLNSGTTDETASAANYQPTARTYTIIVFSNAPVNNVAPYTLDVTLTAAPQRTSFSDTECATVDPHESGPATGNGSQASATPLTVGTVITGALCFQWDTDFYSFSGTAGQTIHVGLLNTLPNHQLQVYRPNGQIFRWTGGTMRLDSSGIWAVAVTGVNDQPTMAQYGLLVADGTCGVNDPNEPNDVTGLATALGAARVRATLCSAGDIDLYRLTANAGQRLTISYPATGAGARLSLSGPDGRTLGSFTGGRQRSFTLADAGSYLITVRNSQLTTPDSPYSFFWQLDAQPPAGDPYLFFGNGATLVRVALSGDHTRMPLLLDGSAAPTTQLYSVPTLGKLFFDETDVFDSGIASVDFSGFNLATLPLPTNVNPEGVFEDSLVALDELNGYVFWTQPTGDVISNDSNIWRANLDGTGSPVQLANTTFTNARALAVDPFNGEIYAIAGRNVLRRDYSGNNPTLIYQAALNETPRDLAYDPYSRMLYWIDPVAGQLKRHALLDGTTGTLISGLAGDARGIVVRAEANELYYSSGSGLFRARLDGTNAVQFATLSGAYEGPSNLDPNAFPLHTFIPPTTNLVLGVGAPIIHPCALADGREPNNDTAAATPVSVITETVISGALCYSTLGNTLPDADYYAVELAAGKILSATLDQLPADYRLVLIHPDGYAAAFSDAAGTAAEFGSVRNTTNAAQTYHVVVLTGSFNMRNLPYRLTLALGDVPPPPPDLPPSDGQCAVVDVHDAPAPGGNGTPADATPLPFGSALSGALCYTADIDVYSFPALAGQTVTIDLPTRPLTAGFPAAYTLTLIDPSGVPTAIISATTTPAYGGSFTLPQAGTWAVAVSHNDPMPTTEQYALLVTDENCVGSDANEPNSAANPTPLAVGDRVRGSLCGGGDVDRFVFSGAAGQVLTLNYPTNATGAALRLFPAAGGADLASVSGGTQTVVTLPAAGDYALEIANGALTQRDVRYLFQLLAGVPPTHGGTPYLYNSGIDRLTRAAVISGMVEPILLDNGGAGGMVIAGDPATNALYVRTYGEQIGRVNPDGSGFTIIIDDSDPLDRGRLLPTLAVNDQTGQIYWSEATGGLNSRILRADVSQTTGDVNGVVEVVAQITDEQALLVDPVGDYLYWVENAFYQNSIEHILRRSNLDGSDVRVLYVAFGRQIQDLAIDPFTRTLYWIDPTQNGVLTLDADSGGDPTLRLALNDAGRGLVVLPFADTLYISAGERLLAADLAGGNVREIAQQTGNYSGVSNLNSSTFYQTTFGAPESNLALLYGTPFAAPCAAVDAFEPNDTPVTAATLTPGSISAALCTADLNAPDLFDYYTVTVQSGQQISVTLGDLPQDYALLLSAPNGAEEWSYNPGLADEFVTHANRSGAAVDYLIAVSRFAGSDSRQPYTLTVELAQAPAPPPPPPPPADLCADVDPYDAPGFDGNWNRANATDIAYNAPITAALCYAADKDYYAFDGEVGQRVTINLDPRPADYLVTLYAPDGSYATGIFPGSSLTYGGNYTLGATGRWTVVVWQQSPVPTTDQYTLELSYDAACAAGDPYEPNGSDDPPTTIVTRTLTLRGTLCQANATFYVNDSDNFRIPVTVGERVRITPRILNAPVEMTIGTPDGFGGHSFNFAVQSVDYVANVDGDVLLRIGIPGFDAYDNIPWELAIVVEDAPPPFVRPANWSCTVYDSGNVGVPIVDLATSSSTLNATTPGTLTYAGLVDVTFEHGYIGDMTFGLQAPNGTAQPLFYFGDYNEYVTCGNPGDQCRFSTNDYAPRGVRPPDPPNVGGSFLPTKGNFSVFNGLAAQGNWSLLIADDGPSGFDSEGYRDSTGILHSWKLELCIDNGTPVEPPPPAATPTPDPLPQDDTPPGDTTGGAAPTMPSSCVPPAADAFEADNTPVTATLLDMAQAVSQGHTFDTISDVDWLLFGASPDFEYEFAAVNAGGNAPVGLAVLGADGTTVLASDTGALTFTPDAAGQFYLRASWAGGISTLCDATYNIALAATPIDPPVIPPPAGAPVPADHSAPAVSAAVLLPTDRAILTATGSVAAQIGLNVDEALGAIVAADVRVNGMPIDNYAGNRRSTEYDIMWDTTWTPGAAGVYTLTAVITDSNGLTATSPINTVYVDLAGPAVTLVEETVTQPLLQNGAIYLIRGTATDDSAIALVEVRIDGGDWQPADLIGTQWQYPWAPAAASNPDGGSVSVDVRVTDVAGNVATTGGMLVVDIIGPDRFELTTTLQSGAPISDTAVVSDLATQVSWPAVPQAQALALGWSNTPTATLAALQSADPNGGSRNHSQMEASVRYLHAIATDAQGNQTVVTRGPFYFDTAATPDLVSDLALTDWPASGGKQIGRAPGTAVGDQALFAGWNDNHLRLRWRGVDVDGGGDLAFYLATTGSGSSALLAGSGGSLPFAADYAVLITSEVTGTLYSAAGGSWSAVGPVTFVTSGSTTDVLLSRSALGLGGRAVGLRLLALATAADGSLLATIPDKNAGWNQYITWSALDAGSVPADGVWADAQIAATVSAEPNPALALGAGDSITLTVAISNSGSAPLPSLTLDGGTTGGVTLTNAPQTVSNLAAGGSVSVTLTGSVVTTGTLSLTLADSYHRPYALGTISYTVDTQPPVSVTVDLGFMGSQTNTIPVSALDASALATFELEIDGPGRAPINVACTPGASPGSFNCQWNAGTVTDGQTYQLRGRATDVHGNTSAWSETFDAPADATPPVLTLSAAALAFLADDKLGTAELVLDGTLSDLAGGAPGLPVGVQICADSATLPCTSTSVAADGTWALRVPTDGTEYSTTLTIIGSDAAGNDSTPITRTVWIDLVAPTFDATTVTRLLAADGTPQTFASGTLNDGDSVASAVALLVPPSATSVIVAPATVNRAGWSVAATFAEVGDYQVLFVATDGAGNTRTQVGGKVTVESDPTAVTLVGLARATAQPALWLPLVTLALAWVSWRLLRRRAA